MGEIWEDVLKPFLVVVGLYIVISPLVILWMKGMFWFADKVALFH